MSNQNIEQIGMLLWPFDGAFGGRRIIQFLEGNHVLGLFYRKKLIISFLCGQIISLPAKGRKVQKEIKMGGVDSYIY